MKTSFASVLRHCFLPVAALAMVPALHACGGKLAPDDDERAVPDERFRGADDQWPGHWASPPRPVDTVPEVRVLAREARGRIAQALETLPDSQRVVVTLRDVAGWDSDEVCDALGLSEGNQRVLLHRGRAKLRAALEQYLEEN